MAELTDELLLSVLRLLAARDPEPFYPAERPPSVDRDTLDRALDHLRLGGLLQLTEWTREKGQGTRLTDHGRQALHDPRLLHLAQPQLREIAPPDEESPWERGEALRQGFMNQRQGIVVRVLLFVNIACFFAAMGLSMSDGIGVGEFLNGRSGRANERLGLLHILLVLAKNEWWRLVTYGFLHVSLLHIAFNMSALWSLGRLLENLWGPVRFTILYFFSLIAGGCFVLAVTDVSPVVGASGALFGLLPSLGAITWLNRDQLPDAWRHNVRQTLTINLIIGVMISMMPGISWTCHLGGALGGLLISFPLQMTRDRRLWIRRLAWLLIPLLFAAMIFGIYVEYSWFEGPADRLFMAIRAGGRK